MTSALRASGLSRVFTEAPGETSQATWALVGAVVLHVSLVAVLPHGRGASREPTRTRAATQFVDLEPPPRPAPTTPPIEPPKEAPSPQTPRRATTAAAAPPPPARAAAVLTQKDDPTAPADLTNTIVVGNAETFVGGTSSAQGTTRREVTFGKASGVDGAGTSPSARTAVGGPDRSERARLAEGGRWDCPFPNEADLAQIDHAVVTLRITVDPAGMPNSVVVTADPGGGFGREARACAMRKRYAPARDHDGAPTVGTSLLNVRFDR